VARQFIAGARALQLDPDAGGGDEVSEPRKSLSAEALGPGASLADRIAWVFDELLKLIPGYPFDPKPAYTVYTTTSCTATGQEYWAEVPR
jgi:hypothetical protein